MRQRLSKRSYRRNRSQRKILNSAELCQQFNVCPADLPGFLRTANIAFHEDAAGGLWASLDSADHQIVSAD
tara:strand:- start:127 stop:339 length:213 start_codon:yes stop_codon:yes gene_type:complete